MPRQSECIPNVDDTPVKGRIGADIVFDMIYNPRKRLFSNRPDLRGKTTIPGMRMLLAQAARQFENLDETNRANERSYAAE
jgi:shikimate 5-dehydrogenase